MTSSKDKKKNVRESSASGPAPVNDRETTLARGSRGQGLRPDETPHDNAKALREREAALTGILNATQESVLLFSADGILRMTNSVALKRLGMSAAEAIGKHINELVPSDLAKSRLARLNDVVRTGKPVEFEDKRAGILFRHMFSPVFDSRGNVSDVAIFSRDITQNREDEERLAYLASFPQLNPNPVLEADLTGTVTFANPAAHRTLIGLGRDSTDIQAFAPEDLNAILAAWDGKSPSTVYREIRIDDRVFSATVYLSPELNAARIYAYDSTERKRIEEALRESEEKYRLLFRNMGEGFALYELLYDDRGAPADWRILEVNDAYALHTGISPDQIVGRRMSELFPDVIPEYLPRFAEVVSTQKPMAFETFSTLSNRYQHVVSFPAGPNRFANTITDITTRKLAEDALREREQKYRTLIDRMIDGFALHEIITDASGQPQDYRFLEVNAAFERLTGLRGADIIGKRVTQVLPGIRKSDFDWIKAYGKVALTGEELRTEQYSEELGKWYSITAYSPQQRFFVTVFEDITARKETERALKESEDRFRTLTESSPDCIALHDKDLRHLYINPAISRLAGLPQEAYLGRTVWEIGMQPEVAAQLDRMLRRTLDSGREYKGELTLPLSDGPRIFQWRSVPILGDDGSIKAIMALASDITALQQATEELRRSREDLNRAQEVGGIGSWRLDVRRNVLTWSDETYRIFGIPKETPMTYEMFLSVVHPDDRAYIEDRWTAALRGENYDVEHRLIVDGRVKWVREKAYLEFDKGGSLVAGFGIAQDITERKRSEEALKNAHAELELRVEERTRELRIANDLVKTERQRLYGVLETLPVYVILLDKDYRIPFANRFFRQRFGDSGGRRCYEYLFNRTEPCETCETYTVLKTKAPHHWYWTGPDKRDYDIYDYPFNESDGSMLILEMGIDITEQKKAQEALRATITEIKQTESRTVLINDLLLLFTREPERKAFLDSTVELIRGWSGCRRVGIRVADEQGNIPYASCAGFSDKFLGSERTLSLEQDHCACTRVVRDAIEPQDLPAMTAGGSFFSNNTAQFMDGLTEEQRSRFRGVCMRSGFLSLAVVPIRYRDRVIGAIHVADDREGMVPIATVEFLEQAALIIGEALFRFSVEQESSRLAAAVESAADAVVVTEPKRGMILYVNDSFEKMTGYSREEAVGKSVHLLDSGRHDEAFYEELRSSLRRDGVWRGQMINMKKDGMLYFEDCTFSPVRDHAGQVISYVSVRRDITEKLRLESIAESVSMLDNIGAVFAGVRHEIGNPINNAKIHLSVLQQKMDAMPASRVREYVDRTLAEIRRVEHLLQTLKTFNLFETPSLEDVATGPMLELFRGLVREDLEARGITLSTQILPGAERVRANARALQHVLLNLTTNAADALKDRQQPRIDIMFSREDDRVRIRVSDNGRGMNTEQIANLFKPFHTTKQHGTGLGLVIVKKMLSTMEGTIDIASHEGSGTAVTIYLPGGNNAGNA